MNKLDTLRKALLFECITMLEKTAMDSSTAHRYRDNTLFDNITLFYSQLGDKFSVKIMLPRPANAIVQEQERRLLGEQRREWVKENGILCFMDWDAFYFSSEEDAAAFKLRWI